MRWTKYNIQTFGCQMNEHDSETIAGMLERMGMTYAERDEADIAIINTCSVRENADKRFFGTLGQLKKRRQRDRNFAVCVCGCMMQQQHVIEEIKNKYPWVDIIFGTQNIHELPDLLNNLDKERKKQKSIYDTSRKTSETGEIVEGLPSKRLFKHKALVNIMYGCNNFCTYCIVPYTRGRERSRQPENILSEIRNLADDGVKEVMLLGQNVNSYKGPLDIGEGKCSKSTCENNAGFMDFTELLYQINDIDGIERIRFMTSHPKDLSERLIQAYVDLDKLCNYIHLPVQSGSSRILKEMNRRYSKEDYLGLVDRIKTAVPEMAMSTDIIVGFPGETEEDFEETLDLVRKAEFDSAFTFLYSIRKGTPAAEYENQIPEKIKHERFERLVELVNSISAEKNLAYEGRIEKVLVEGRSRHNKETFTGRTESFKLVNFEADESLLGEIVEIKITEGKTFNLTGELIKNK